MKDLAKNITGELSVHYEGYGFVVPKEAGLADVFIPARSIGDALHGDVVEVKVQKNKKGLFEGSIVKILKRGLTQFVGRLEHHGASWVVVSENERVRHTLHLSQIPVGCVSGDTVVAKIEAYPSGKNPLRGSVIQKLPRRGSLFSEIEFVIAKHQWPPHFSEAVHQEAEKQSVIQAQSEDKGRRNLCHLPFVTIDGDDAKDFDDAVCVQRLDSGFFRLWVAIADVSHFVGWNSLLDQEAFGRATSVYFPGRVLPMLPEVLSNDWCSLKPSVLRKVLVAELTLDPRGNVLEESFYSGLIQSHARLTYTLVQRLLDGDAALKERYQTLFPMIAMLSQLAAAFKTLRNQRGSLDFDLPEPDIILNLTGGIEHIERAERHWSHQIVEELMIAANEAVARYLTKAKIGCIYRIHESPEEEKIQRFFKLVSRLGFKGRFHLPVSSIELGKILKFFKGHTEERFVNSLLLRSLPQAIYATGNRGHFGLASSCYCHFTSPIRRYPDLVVHRLLKMKWEGEISKPMRHALKERLIAIAEQSSLQERKAMSMEREMIALHMAEFMAQKKGEILSGIISHVTKFGFFVELIDYFVEGLVLKQDLKGDQYEYDEESLSLKGKKTRKRFKIGDHVTIQVKGTNLLERRVFFNLLDRNQKGQLR